MIDEYPLFHIIYTGVWVVNDSAVIQLIDNSQVEISHAKGLVSFQNVDKPLKQT